MGKKNRRHPAQNPASARSAIRRLGNNGGGFFTRGDDEAVRQSLGEEHYQRMRRTMELMRNPRPLTEADAAVLRAAVAPLLRDLAATGMPLPDIRTEAHEDRECAVCGWIAMPGGFGQGVWVLRDHSHAEQVAELAEQFQNWAADYLVEAGHSPDWPACPAHGGDRGLAAEVRDGAAVWVCREDGRVISPIGALPG